MNDIYKDPEVDDEEQPVQTGISFPLENETEKKGQRIGEEAATATFNELLDYYRIKFAHIVNDQGKEGAETLQNKLVEAIRDGLIETRRDPDPEKGFQIIQNTLTGKTVVYNEYGFAAARESARAKDSETAHVALLASLCGKGVPYFESKKNFSGPDLKLAEFIAVLFLL